MVRYKFVLILFVPLCGLFAQENPLELYIQAGLEGNLALKQQEFSLAQSLEALKEARGMFLPSINIGARYSRAGGGREFTIPVGDLVNPIYTTLNQLLSSHGQIPAFPESIPNETILFLREEEHETKIRLVQPIIQPAIWSNYGLKSKLQEIEQAQTIIFKRRLIADIKRAYYNYLKATQIVDLYEKIENLQNENLRVSEKLFAAGKVTQDVVFRAQAELSGTQREKMHVESLQRQSQSYFNFIINRPLESDIKTTEEQKAEDPIALDYEAARQYAFKSREELKQIKNAISAANKNAAIIRSKYFPGLNGVIDYGFQGEKYSFTEKDDYWMASLVLEWNLFNGFQDNAKLEQAYLEGKKLSTREVEVKKQIELEVERTYDNLNVARKTIEVTEQQNESAQASFRIIRKKYEEGMTSQVEYLDAQTTLTNASISAIISRYDYHITYAEFERITALYQL